MNFFTVSGTFWVRRYVRRESLKIFFSENWCSDKRITDNPQKIFIWLNYCGWVSFLNFSNKILLGYI